MPNSVLDQDRVTFLQARDSQRRAPVVAWPRQEKDLPLVEVGVEWLRFSTLNHRTRAEQRRAVHLSGQPSLFTNDPLGPLAQDAQYQILRDQEGFGALKADLKERGQQDPAIVTADGVLINGNRRAAAMRSLYRDDAFPPACYLKCLVLPQDATAPELVDLEAELQVARDFKQDYSWINEALLIEELFDREHKDFALVAARTHRDVTDVRALHEKLQQVHQLVALSNGARLHIDFKDNESAFDELARYIRTRPAAEAEAVRAVYFLGTLAEVNYRKLRHLRRADAAQLVERELGDTLMAVLNPDPDPDPDPDTANDGPAAADPLDDALGGPAPAPPPLIALLGLVATRRRAETLTLANGDELEIDALLNTVQSAVTAAADEAEEEQRDQTAVTAPTVRAAKAIEELKRAVTALPKARSLPEWDEAGLAAKTAIIKELLSQLRAGC